MSRSKSITAHDEVTAEACSWVAQLESGNLTSSDLVALREWMNRSPQHARELRSIASLSCDLSALTELAEPLAEVSGQDNELRKPVWKRLSPAPILACCVAVFSALFLLAALLQNPGKIDTEPRIYATAIGEYRTIELNDRSTVKLNTASQIEVAYTDQTRRIRLIRGEALFDVTPDPKRPFEVYSGETVTRAIGTSFVVRLRNAVTELAVVEGKVAFSKAVNSILKEVESTAPPKAAVSLENNSNENAFVLVAGQVLTSAAIDDTKIDSVQTKPIAVDTRSLRRKLSWTEGLFDFSDTPLEEVVSEVTRHNSVVIDIADDDLRDLRFGGMFRTGDTESLLEALQGLGVEVVHVDESHIRLQKRADR